MTEKIRKFFAVLLLCVFAVTLFCPVMHAGEAKKVIRVAYGADNIILNQNSNGFYQGYGVAYLNKISQYTGWTYEYVEESWEKQFYDLWSVSSLFESRIVILPRESLTSPST